MKTTDGLYKDFEEALQRVHLSRAGLARKARTQAAGVRRLFGRASPHNPTLSTLSKLAAALGCQIRLVQAEDLRGTDGCESSETELLKDELRKLAAQRFATVLADPPWRFQNRTGKVAPEHRRLSRYDTLSVADMCALPVREVVAQNAHLYLWVPNALIAEGLRVMQAWGFTYKANIVWAKRRKDGGPDGRGVGFYFRNVTELILFGTRGKMRTLQAGRRQVNLIETQKREHSRKPDEQYNLIEACSPGPYLELFARYPRERWTSWGLEAPAHIRPRGRQYPTYGGGPTRPRNASDTLPLFES